MRFVPKRGYSGGMSTAGSPAVTVTEVGPVRPGRPNRWRITGPADTFWVTDRHYRKPAVCWHRDGDVYTVAEVDTASEATAIAVECATRGGDAVMAERLASRIAASR